MSDAERIECICGKLLFKVVDGVIEIKCRNKDCSKDGDVVKLRPIIIDGKLITFERI